MTQLSLRRWGRSRLTLLALIAGLCVAVPTGAAWSATATQEAPVTWAVTPSDADGPDGRTTVSLSLDPGATTTDHLAVRNLGEAEATFSLTAADGYYTDTGRFNMLDAGETSKDSGTWISVDPTVTIPAGETAVIPFTVAVPANATPGDHAAGIAASVRTTATDADGTQVGVDSRVGFRVSTRVSGELAPALEVSTVEAGYTASWSLFSPGRATVSYTATNAGNTALQLHDTVGDTATEHGSLLPGEQRTVTVDQVPAWPLGMLFLDLRVEGAVPGAELTAAPFTDTLILWAVPWLHLLATLGVVLVLLAIFTGRRRNKRRLERLLDEAREAGRRDATEVVPTA